MFKIENYIAPLILSKVEKFVKNINPNEFQVSLWQGDVIFQNLELKLDALEEELQLPINFLSGHINDLKISIPWTKISSEPIIITVNTIELVVKLKDFSASSPKMQKPKLKKKISVEEETSSAGSAGYMASLISKILNNISIICNNIVLKFVEEDIVVSMNIQHLSIHSADHRWKRSYIDVSPTIVLFRKLINIIDLTICLDKRNSSGKIEFVNEPILYKCSMELRLFRKFNSQSPKKLSMTRIDLHSTAVNLSISSQQFPMLLKLYDLMMALKSGKLQAIHHENQQPDTSEGNEEDDNDSWLIWMWNMIPDILSEEQTNEHLEASDKKVFEFGLYLDSASLILKSQELLSDPIIPTTKKMELRPIIEINAQKVHAVTIICGIRCFNVQCGIGYIEIKASDECPCNAKTTESLILNSGIIDNSISYMKDSFMDKTAISKKSKYEELWNNYYERHSEEALLARSPAMAMDILHSVEIPDDVRSSEIGSDLEYSNFSEAYVIRVFCSQMILNANADMIHRVEKIIQFYKECDFIPYIEPEKTLLRNQLSPATSDDYDALISDVPMKTIKVKLKDSVIKVQEWNHEKSSKARKIAKQNSSVHLSIKTPVLEIKIDDAQFNISQPLYKNRLIYTVCQLPDAKLNELYAKCFAIMSVVLKTVKIEMIQNQSKRICEVVNVHGESRQLLYPHLWTENDLNENMHSLSVEHVSFMMNPAQLLVFKSIMFSMCNRSIDNDVEYVVANSLECSNLVVIQLVMQSLKMKFVETNLSYCGKFSIAHLLAMTWKNDKKSLILTWPDEISKSPVNRNQNNKTRKTEIMMSISFQIPKNLMDLNAIPVLSAKISKGSFNVDPFLREFLVFNSSVQAQKNERLIRIPTSSTKLVHNASSNNQVPSVHSSSEGDVTITICPQTFDAESSKAIKNCINWTNVVKKTVVRIEINHLNFYYTTFVIDTFKPSDSIDRLLGDSETEMVSSKMPKITFYSVKMKNVLENVNPFIANALPANMWSSNEQSHTWNLSIANFEVSSKKDGRNYDFVKDFSMTISIADETPADYENCQNYFGNILIETTPLDIHMHTSQVNLLKSMITNILAIFKKPPKMHQMSTSKQYKLPVIQESPQNAIEIKEFLGLATGSTTTKTSHADDGSNRTKSNNNLYIQWVCSKISFCFIANELEMQKKLVFELEEILFSLHHQDFYQMKSKIAGICGTLFQRVNSDADWIKNKTLSLNVQLEENISDNANRFLDLTITKAETSNVHAKWNIGHKRNRLSNDDITEINVIMQPLSIVFNFDELVSFAPIFVAFSSTKKKSEPSSGRRCTAGSDLPLLYVKCNSLTVFLPCLSGNNLLSDVLIVKLNELRITPTALNNLLRNQILRPDIHSKAYSLGILDLAGSKIEDRQYQLMVKGVSLSTSKWDKIDALLNEKEIIQSYENPALEWNNLENGPKPPNFELKTIFKDSTFSFIYAPAIKFKDTLIAGKAAEFNCVNDMNIDVSLDEIALFMNFADKANTTLQMLNPKVQADLKEEGSLKSERTPEKKTENRKSHEKKSFDDSGVESISHSNQIAARRLWRKQKSMSFAEEEAETPFEMTFTSSMFNIKCSHENDNIQFVFDTPNIYLTKDRFEKSTKLSLHDMKITLEDDTERFVIFATREGECDVSGISPSLIRIKLTEKALKNNDCDVQIKRPLLFQMSHEKLFKIQDLQRRLIGKVSSKNPSKYSSTPMNPKIRKIDSFKSHFHNFKTCNIATSQIVFKTHSCDYNLKIAASHVKSRFRVFERPEKIEMNTEVENFMAFDDGNIVVHPLNVQMKVKIAQEYWKKDPLIYININCGFLKIDFRPELIKDVLLCQKMFEQVLKRNENNEIDCVNVKNNSSELIELQSKHYENRRNISVEHFQDDLRSGAFQFVETSSLRDLPLPYQIQIVDNEIGVICWRYPLPRALHKIKIFPVPFQTANQVSIICKIEYFCPLKSQFVEFCDFKLTENETKVLDLKENRPFAEVWRIKIPKVFLKRDSDDEEDESDYEFQMHPKVLVACLRIDSYYVANAVPSIAALFKMSHIEVNIFNKQLESEDLPDAIKNFNILAVGPKEHEAIKVSLESLQVLGHFFDEKFENIEVDSFLKVDIIDYSFENLTPLVEKFRLKALLNLHHDDININLMSEKANLKYSPSICHSVLVTKRIWEYHLMMSVEKNKKTMIINSKYVICNNTSYPVGIGQAQSNEMICLLPQSCSLYSFRTDKKDQALQLCVCINGAWTHKTEPIFLHKEGIEYLKMEPDQYFCVTTKQITNFQRKITIDGQVQVFNMTKEIFKLQYKRYDKDTVDSPDKCESQEFELHEYNNCSVFGTCLIDSHQSIRLKLIATEMKGFSGEIPLREIVANNKPWLVKVPSTRTGGFNSFWVRIIRQTFNCEIQRVLVVIWPMFMVKSLFPYNIIAHEPKSNQNFVIAGCGEVCELDVFGTHEDEHELTIKGNTLSSSDGVDDPKVTLSYKLINRNSFFRIPDEFSDIQKACEMLESHSDEVWPKKTDSEVFNYEHQVSKGPSTVPLYKFSSQHPEDLSCSLLLTLTPWCLVVNSTGSSVLISKLSTDETQTIEPNHYSVPLNIDNLFTLSICFDDVWFKSDLIIISPEVKKSTTNSYTLPLDGQININIFGSSGVVQLVLTSSFENKFRLITISSMLVISNYSKFDLNVYSFAAIIGEKIEGVKRNELTSKTSVHLYRNHKRTISSGNPIALFRDLTGNAKRKFLSTLSSFIVIGHKTTEVSCPIKIQGVMRKCINVPNMNLNIPISVSIIKHNQQYYMSIYDDNSPYLTIKNDTDFHLFIAQTDLSNQNAKNILPHKEVADERFLWYQVVSSKQSVFYTPPTIDEHFPEVINIDYGLIFACVTGDNIIRWSQPIKVDGNKKIIINVPMFGDLKLNVKVHRRTSSIIISYIDSDKDRRMKDSQYRDEMQSMQNASFLEINSNYQRTFCLSSKSSRKALNINFFMEGVNISISRDDQNTGKRTNMISINFDEIGIQYSRLACKMSLNIAKLQVDNELFSSGEYDFPVVLCNKDVSTTQIDEAIFKNSIWNLPNIFESRKSKELFHINLDLYEEDSSIENVSVKLQPLKIFIEDTFINVLLEIVDDCLPKNLIMKNKEKSVSVKLEAGLVLIPRIVEEHSQYLAEPIRMRRIQLEPVHALLSVHTCIRMYIALDHSPLDFSIYEKMNVYTLPLKLGNSIGLHYLSSAIFGAGWVVGSLEILGSPSGLARSVTSGVKDFVSMPVQGLFKGPWGFVVGLTQGSASLLRNVTTGTVNSVTKLATSLARNLDRLTLDSEHIYLKTDNSRRHRPQGLSDGIQQGLTGFGISILGAIGGLARHPLQARSTVEVFTGVGKGLVGVLAKPISGAAEFLALTGSGMLQSVGYNILPNPIHANCIEKELLEPVPEKIISKQLMQHATSNRTLFACRGTFVRNNDMQNSLVILLSNVLVIVDLDCDTVMEIIPLENIQPLSSKQAADNLFIFKIKKNNEAHVETSPEEEKYPVSKRVIQYVQQVSGLQTSIIADKTSEGSSDDDNNHKHSPDDSPDDQLIDSSKISFYIDETTGKYLVNYINLVKQLASSKLTLFPLI